MVNNSEFAIAVIDSPFSEFLREKQRKWELIHTEKSTVVNEEISHKISKTTKAYYKILKILQRVFKNVL
jgi:hypothetical protein